MIVQYHGISGMEKPAGRLLLVALTGTIRRIENDPQLC